MTQEHNTRRNSYFYCDFCGTVKQHVRLSDFQWNIEYTNKSNSTLDRFSSVIFVKYNPVVAVVKGIAAVLGDPIEHWKCTGCMAYASSTTATKHSFFLDEKWWDREELIENPQILERVRSKYNPNLLKSS